LEEHAVNKLIEISAAKSTFEVRIGMLSKNLIKQIQGLRLKKNRIEEGLFIVEGTKSVIELLRSKIRVNKLIATTDWLQHHESEYKNAHIETFEANVDELIKVSNLSTPQHTIAIAVIDKIDDLPDSRAQFVIALDNIQDPGNMGTILRIADWYGISSIISNENTVEWHNPKCIQASMGSFSRVSVHKTGLVEYFKEQQPKIVYGAVLNGKNIYTTTIEKNGILLIGNEGNGVSEELIPFITEPISIPRSGDAESLNAAIATAIICDARARNLFSKGRN
jgi:TrmH family RNA methyltransferase